MEDSDDEEETTPAKPPTPKSKPKTKSYVFRTTLTSKLSNFLTHVSSTGSPRKPRESPQLHRTTLVLARNQRNRSLQLKPRLEKVNRRRAHPPSLPGPPQKSPPKTPLRKSMKISAVTIYLHQSTLKPARGMMTTLKKRTRTMTSRSWKSSQLPLHRNDRHTRRNPPTRMRMRMW